MNKSSKFCVIFAVFAFLTMPVFLLPMEQQNQSLDAFLKALAQDEKAVLAKPYRPSTIFNLPAATMKNLPPRIINHLTKYNELYNTAALTTRVEPFRQKVAELRKEAQTRASKPIKPTGAPVQKELQTTIDALYTQFIADQTIFLTSQSANELNTILKQIKMYQEQTQAKEAYQDFVKAIKARLETKKTAPEKPSAPQIAKGLQEKIDTLFLNFLVNQEDFFNARTNPADIKELQELVPVIRAKQAQDKTAYQGFAQAIEAHVAKYMPVKKGKEEIEEPKQGTAYTHYQGTQLPGVDPQNMGYLKMTIQKTQKEFDQNEQQLNNSKTRFLRLSATLAKAPIFNIRSIQQMNGWLCGHLLLFNAYIIDQNLSETANIALSENLIINKLLPRAQYNWPEFKEIYNSLTFFGYSENLIKKSTIDPFTGLKSPASLEDFESGFLSDDEIIERAQGMLQNELYIIGKESGNFILQGGTESEAPFTVSTQDTIANLAKIHNKKRGTPYLIHFACRLAAAHWVLVSVINTGSTQNNRGLLILDSQNSPLGQTDAGKQEIITLIARAFGLM